ELPFNLLAAFLVGFLGSLHCVGMCGGIVGALTLRLPQEVRASPIRLLPYVLSYNIGRIVSYAIAGALAGLLGAQALAVLSFENAQLVGKWVSAIFMMALGLYIAGWSRGLVDLERLGARLWRTIEPLGRRYLSLAGPHEAAALGLVWGWLPCGLVYAVLAWSFVAGGALQGAALMLAFGMGTLPMLLAMGAASRWLGSLVHTPRLRRAVGAAILLFGVFALIVPIGHHTQTHVTAEPADVTVSPGHAMLRHDGRFGENMLSPTGYLYAGKEGH
ncbi:MAG: sulfite exporter TauE/SafE family protein, partial [Acidiferrobacterales bacterium]|nr:sulfite exporter TauE/SafE family protein [Acidiferrobacterales bacterium]